MKPQEVERLLADYTSASLTSEQEQVLFSIALKNQDTFHRLMHQIEIRDIVSNPEARRILGRSLDRDLETDGSWGTEFKEWLIGSRGLLALVLVAALMVIGIALPRLWSPRTGDDLQALNTGSLDSRLQAVLALPVRTGIPIEVSLNHDGQRPVYRVGERLRLEVRSLIAAQLVAVETGPGSSFRVLVSDPSGEPIPLKANESRYFPSEGHDGFAVNGSPGVRRIRWIVLPQGTRLPKPDGWGGIVGLTLIETEYIVTP